MGHGHHRDGTGPTGAVRAGFRVACIGPARRAAVLDGRDHERRACSGPVGAGRRDGQQEPEGPGRRRPGAGAVGQAGSSEAVAPGAGTRVGGRGPRSGKSTAPPGPWPPPSKWAMRRSRTGPAEDSSIFPARRRSATTPCSRTRPGATAAGNAAWPVAESLRRPGQTGRWWAASPSTKPGAPLVSMRLIDDLEAIVELNDLCNRAGIDTISAGRDRRLCHRMFRSRGCCRRRTRTACISPGAMPPQRSPSSPRSCDAKGWAILLADGVARAAARIGGQAGDYADAHRRPGGADARPAADHALPARLPSRRHTGPPQPGERRAHRHAPRLDRAGGRRHLVSGRLRGPAGRAPQLANLMHAINASGLCSFAVCSFVDRFILPEFMEVVAGWSMVPRISTGWGTASAPCAWPTTTASAWTPGLGGPGADPGPASAGGGPAAGCPLGTSVAKFPPTARLPAGTRTRASQLRPRCANWAFRTCSAICGRIQGASRIAMEQVYDWIVRGGRLGDAHRGPSPSSRRGARRRHHRRHRLPGAGQGQAGAGCRRPGRVPRLIDADADADLWRLRDPLDEPKLRQGVTTEILGEDGLSHARDRPRPRPRWTACGRASTAARRRRARRGIRCPGPLRAGRLDRGETQAFLRPG